jgi:predicted 3-demethylubiquinone-9 3-methyltransferase (glyoxalase superfamily)
MQKISTFLWFDDNALEAAQFYTSIFRNSAINESVTAAPRTVAPRHGGNDENGQAGYRNLAGGVCRRSRMTNEASDRELGAYPSGR